MAPVPLVPDCRDGAYGTPSSVAGNFTTEAPDTGVNQDDLSALLYIVVTLLFYSMGIVVGIITYLKRERADMEEEKVFDMYLTMKRDPFNMHRQERVQQMARRLRKMERAKADRLEREKLAMAAAGNDDDDSGSSDGEGGQGCRRDSRRCKHVKISDCVPMRTPSTRSARKDSGGTDNDGTVIFPLVLSTANMMVGSTSMRSPLLHMSPSSSEYQLVPVTKQGVECERRGALPAGVDPERRGALPMGASALHVREPGGLGGSDSALLVSGPVVSQPASASPVEDDDVL